MDDKHFIQRDLLKRGWTKPLIARLLGEPDKTHARLEGGKYYLFERKRVERAEKRKLWRTEVARLTAGREARRISALKRKLVKDYLLEIRDSTGNEFDHWSDHPAVAAYGEEVRQRMQLELLARHGILPALFAVNREAKRLRDASQAAYNSRDYAEATKCKAKKGHLYWLKGQVLEHLWGDREVERVGWHKFPGDLVAEVLAGGGYRFHRPAAGAPEGAKLLSLNQIEAKPAEVGEVPAQEAEEAVQGFLQCRAKLKVYQWPERERKSHWHYDYDDDEHDDDRW